MWNSRSLEEQNDLWLCRHGDGLLVTSPTLWQWDVPHVYGKLPRKDIQNRSSWIDGFGAFWTLIPKTLAFTKISEEFWDELRYHRYHGTISSNGLLKTPGQEAQPRHWFDTIHWDLELIDTIPALHRPRGVRLCQGWNAGGRGSDDVFSIGAI